MTTLPVRSILAAAAAGLSLWAAPVHANVQANCDWYAKTALKQHQENEQRKCGLTGPNWTSDMRAHMTWCLANPDQFRTEAQRRDQQLAGCKK